jgi:hypothetical protein
MPWFGDPDGACLRRKAWGRISGCVSIVLADAFPCNWVSVFSVFHVAFTDIGKTVVALTRKDLVPWQLGG